MESTSANRRPPQSTDQPRTVPPVTAFVETGIDPCRLGLGVHGVKAIDIDENGHFVAGQFGNLRPGWDAWARGKRVGRSSSAIRPSRAQEKMNASIRYPSYQLGANFETSSATR